MFSCFICEYWTLSLSLKLKHKATKWSFMKNKMLICCKSYRCVDSQSWGNLIIHWCPSVYLDGFLWICFHRFDKTLWGISITIYVHRLLIFPLEWQSSGSPPSAFQVPYDSFKEQCSNVTDSSHGVNYSTDALEENKSKDLEYDFNCFFLSSQRLDLYRLIDYRCEDMLSGRSCY